MTFLRLQPCSNSELNVFVCLRRKKNKVECKNIQLFRPAFGVTNPNIAHAVKALNLTAIGWNQRSLDTTSLSEDAIFKRITKNLKPGDVILLHDTSEKK